MSYVFHMLKPKGYTVILVILSHVSTEIDMMDANQAPV